MNFDVGSIQRFYRYQLVLYFDVGSIQRFYFAKLKRGRQNYDRSSTLKLCCCRCYHFVVINVPLKISACPIFYNVFIFDFFFSV